MDGEDGPYADVAARIPAAAAQLDGTNDMNAQPSSSWDEEWESIFRRRAWGRYPPEHVIRFVARSFGGRTDRNSVALLDVGTGAGGACAWYMAREGFTVSAIE